MSKNLKRKQPAPTHRQSYEPDVKQQSRQSDHQEDEMLTPFAKEPKTGPKIPGLNYKLTQKSAFNYKVTMAEKKTISLCSASEMGILASEKGKIYFKLEDTKDSKGVHECLKQIDAFTDTVIEAVESDLQEGWGISNSAFRNISYIKKNGDEAWIAETKNEGQKYRSICLFPHHHYTKYYDYDVATNATSKSNGGLAAKIGVSANSRWTVALSLKAVDVTYNPQAKTITFMTWVSPGHIVWFDEGQDTTVDEEKKEAAKKQREEDELAKILLDVQAYAKKVKVDKQTADRIMESQTNPVVKMLSKQFGTPSSINGVDVESE